MFDRQKLKDEIARLNYRIAVLEERLCPCGSHDWKEVNHYYTSFYDWTVYEFKCKRCGKYKKEIH